MAATKANQPKAKTLPPSKQKQNQRAEIANLKAQLETVTSELEQTRAMLARTDANAFLGTLPEPIKQYSPDLIPRTLALASCGMSIIEIGAEFGVDEKTLVKWQEKYPQFRAALHRARVNARAYWLRKGREAIEANNWRFRLAELPTLVDALFPEDDMANGDSADVVHVAIGREARALFSREVQS
jgi:hypothetical protein